MAKQQSFVPFINIVFTKIDDTNCLKLDCDKT